MFTPVQTFSGGSLSHLSTQGSLEDTGRVFGISGIVSEAAFGDKARWRWAVIAGLVAGPALVHTVGIAPYVPDPTAWTWTAMSPARFALAGGLIGFGSKMGSGCTSGHMLCGVSRSSPRSIVATAVFFMTAVSTAKFFPAPVNVPPPAYQLAPFSGQGTLALLGTVLGFVAAKKLIDRLVPRCVKPTVPAPDAAECERITESPAGSATYLWAGSSFGVGLVMSGMISSLKVSGFLRLPPPLDSFDPSLGMVMSGGVLPNALSYFGMMKESNGHPKPRFGWEQWRVPTRKDINPRLIAGAAIFGVGWGLCGVCPGPAISTSGEIAVAAANGVSLDKLQPGFTAWGAYIANMLAGMYAVKLVDSVIA